MQITIKDSLIKRVLADHLEDQLGKRQPKMVKQIMADTKVMKRLAKALEAYFNEEADVISDKLEDIEIPVRDNEVWG